MSRTIAIAAALLTLCTGSAMSGTVTVTKIDGRTETFVGAEEFFVRVQENGGKVAVVIDANGEEQIFYGVSVKYTPTDDAPSS